MTRIIPIASGKGGVGKTSFASNLAISLSQSNKVVIVVDLDLGGSNLHTMLGISNKHNGIGDLINKKISSLDSALVESQYPRLYFIPGDKLFVGSANLSFFAKQKIIQGIKNLYADYIILDLGSGTSYNVLDFFLLSYDGIIVTIPEITSLLNAYSMIKNAVYRLLYISFNNRSHERSILDNFSKEKIEDQDVDFLEILNRLDSYKLSSGSKARSILSLYKPRIVLNRVSNHAKDLKLAQRLEQTIYKNLKMKADYLGYLPEDPQIHESINQRKPIYISSKNNLWCNHLDFIKEKILNFPILGTPTVFQSIIDMTKEVDDYLSDH